VEPEPFATWAERILRDQQQRLDHYDALHTEHVTRMEAMSRSQQRAQTLLHSLLEDIHQRMTQNEVLAAKVQLTLDAVLEMLRHRNGH